MYACRLRAQLKGGVSFMGSGSPVRSVNTTAEWRPDLDAEALDAFNQDWSMLQGRGYAKLGRESTEHSTCMSTGSNPGSDSSGMEEQAMVSHTASDDSEIPQFFSLTRRTSSSQPTQRVYQRWCLN